MLFLGGAINENPWGGTTFMPTHDNMVALVHTISQRISMGPQQGQKVFTLQTLFANVDEPEKLERLCRYISRPAISEQRLSISNQGQVRYELQTPYFNGTTHVFFSPIHFMGKLAALIPPPRLNLTRFSEHSRQTIT